jgi:hypothetical protein
VVGGSYGTFWGRIETYAEFWWGNLMEGDRLEDLSVDGRMILRRTDLTVKGRVDMAWLNQAQDRDKRRAVVNTLWNS